MRGTTPDDWAVGDWVAFSDLATDAWQKIDNSSVLSGAGTGGTIPVWAGAGTSVTLADAPITVSGNDATFAGSDITLLNEVTLLVPYGLVDTTEVPVHILQVLLNQGARHWLQGGRMLTQLWQTPLTAADLLGQ